MIEKAHPQPKVVGARQHNVDVMGFFAKYGTIVALVALVLFNLWHTPNFATMQTLNINLTQVSTIVIVAVGMTLVIATGGVDLSVGSLMAIAGALAPLIFTGKLFGIGNIYLGVAVAMFVSLLLTGLLGLFNGYLVARFKIQPIVATLILFIAGRGIAQVMTNGNLQTFTVPQFSWIGLGRPFGIPTQVIIMVAMVVLAAWVLKKTVFGRHVLAVGGNETAALLAGLPVARVKLAVYTISGLCAGLAGLVVIGINSSSDANLVGLGMELDAIAAVAVGGTLMSGGKATIVGTLLGALTIQLVRYTLLSNGVPDAAALVVKAGIIAVAVWLQRQQRSQ